MESKSVAISKSKSDPDALCVLVVDDDASMRNSLRRVLQLDGYWVATAGTGADLLADPELENYFAILLDRKLPDMDASEVIDELRQRAPSTAILIVTGYADIAHTITSIRQGIDDYLVKPVEPETLRTRLSALAELYRVKRELRRSENRMRFLAEHLPAGAVYIDGNRFHGNHAVQRYTGYASDEIQTIEAWFGRLCGDPSERYRHHYLRLREANFPETFTLPIVRKDGARRTLEIAGYRYDQHEIWLVIDVTELRQAQQKLVQSERLAAIGEMVTGLAHESRNALQRARGCLDLLELDLQGQLEQLDLTQRIRRSLNDLQRHYEEVRNYAAPIVLQKSVFDCEELLKETFHDLQCEFQNVDHRLVIQAAGSATKIEADRHRMTQVFRNLLENAIAASKHGAQIEVRFDHETIGRDAFVSITMKDSGEGMGEETMARMFEPFFTTKQSGTGLGMAICKRIIDAHEGSISATSEPGRGATIKMLLPA